MKKQITTVILVALLGIQISYAQWSTASLSSSRQYLAAASAGDKALFAGGIGMISVPPPAVDIYNNTNGTWTGATLSKGRTSLAGAGLNNKVLFAGGADDWILSIYDKVDIYDATTSLWTQAILSAPRIKLAAAGAGNKILFAGGCDPNNGTSSNVVDLYSTTTGGWGVSQPLTVPRFNLCGAGAGNKVVFAGGTDFGGNFYDNVEIYDVITNMWSTATLSQARYGCAAAAYGDKIYIAGGIALTGPSNVVDIYDVVTNTWTVDSLSEARGFIMAGTASNRLFFAGGSSDATYTTASKRVDIFNATTGTWAIDSMANPRVLGAATGVANKFIVAGGFPGGSGFPTNSIEMYTVVNTGIEHIVNENGFTVSPNPALSNVTIQLNNANPYGILDIYNSTGKNVHHQVISNLSKVDISVNELPSGIYYVRFNDGHSTYTNKLIRN